MGSVKDLRVLREATPLAHGKGRFIFSNRYSVFDWGEMPDLIDFKGEAITILAAYFFEKLEQMNIPTHYLGLVEDLTSKKLPEIKKPTNTMEVQLLRVIRPELKTDQYDYAVYRALKGCFLVPLEVIYRNYLPPGSSVFRRLKDNEATLKDLGLSSNPEPNQKLDKSIFDVSTKLEVTDRYLKWSEAQFIAGLNDDEMKNLKNLLNTVNDLITKEFSKINLINEDGKIELGFDQDRRLMIVDVLGTLDECRFTSSFNPGVPISKEITRIYYRNTDWYNATQEAKKTDLQHWKEICKIKPEPLPPRLKLLISQVYCACTNQITEREWFTNIPPLNDILNELKDILKL
ncbi:phosphoribosylaminoimidazolesuccinocarboxamide synthase [Candidatus Poribacteria bacterium]|nr:phosphoribosylaminoimidazolesuccinocarboxamide synthase [Candidatus Poribacteria bacterium]